MTENKDIYADFICAQTNAVCDTGWCNVMVDVVNDFAPVSCVPVEYTSHSDFKDRCKLCAVYKDFCNS